MSKDRKTLEEMAAEAHSSSDGRIACPKCGCQDFKTYGGSRGSVSRFHYKSCRHCGHKILTSSRTIERIVRDVKPHEDEEDLDDEPLLRLLG